MKQLTLKRFIHISEQGQEPKEAPSMEIDINIEFDDEEYVVKSVDTKIFGKTWEKDNQPFLKSFQEVIYNITDEVDLAEEFKNK
mgnify:FL=1